MDIEAARKTLSKRSALSPKRIAFFAVAGVLLAAGILLRSVQYFGQQAEPTPPAAAVPPPAAVAPTTAPTSSVSEAQPATQETAHMPSAQETVPAPAEQDKANATIEQAEPAPESPGQPGQADSLGSEILVSKRPVAVLASPSASAPVLYGLPAGRQFRMLGHEGSFAHIQDLSSSASGWIDEAALAAQPRVPLASAPSQSRPVAASRPPAANASAEQQKPKASSAGGQVAAGSEPAAPAEREPRGLFGGGGILRNIFGGGN